MGSISPPEPTGLAGAEQKAESSQEHRDRLSKMAAEPWGKFLLGTALKIAGVVAVAAILFWLLSRLRGY